MSRWPGGLLRALLANSRLTLRGLRRARSLSIAVVLVLAVGIGATTAIFSVVDHILFRPLDVPHSDRVITICETNPKVAGWCTVATPNLVDWSKRSKVFEAIGAARSQTMSWQDTGRAAGTVVGIATPGFLRAVGASTALGRLITPEDGPPRGDGKVVVLTDRFWRHRLAADPHVLGRKLVLDKASYTVIGVLKPGVLIPRLDYASAWLPLPWDPTKAEYRDWRGFVAAARLAPGVSVRQAQSELQAVESSLADRYPEALRGWSVEVRSMKDYLVHGSRPTLLAFLVAVGLVLLLVCATVSSLLLTRATSRRRGLAVRHALGASRWRLLADLLGESVVLAALGGALGVLLAIWGVRLFHLLAPAGIPRIDEVTVDGRILAFAILISLASGLAAGALPALRLSKVRAVEAFRAGRSSTADRGTRRLHRFLVVGQLALALILVIGAGLLLRSFSNLIDWQPGFDTDHLLTFWTFASQGKYPKSTQVLETYREITKSLRALPGVRSVGTVSAGPLFGGGDGVTPVLISGRGWTPEEAPRVAWYDAGPGYFPTLGVPLVRGRLFEESDDSGSPAVALINRAMARRLWPGRDPIGTTLELPQLDGHERVRVIGVVGDVKPFLPERATAPEIYLSNRQRTRWATYFVIRTDGSASKLAPAVRRSLSRIDPDLEAAQMGTMGEHIAWQLVRPRFAMVLVAIFALIALLIASVGVYGVVSYALQARSDEFAIRIALGASPRGITLTTLGESLAMVAVSAAVGLGGALWLSGLLGNLIHGVSTHDALTFSVAVLVLGMVAMLAAIRPARRAARVDPMKVLRDE